MFIVDIALGKSQTPDSWESLITSANTSTNRSTSAISKKEYVIDISWVPKSVVGLGVGVFY